MTETNGPFPGPRPFLLTESGRFFGRDDDAESLAKLWRNNRLTVVAGPAGCGKTSLITAGVYPLVIGGGPEVLQPGRLTHGPTFPTASLPPHNPFTLALLMSWDPGAMPSRLAGATVHDFLRYRAERHGSGVLAAVDQIEELPRDLGPRWTAAQRFLHELTEAALAGSDGLHLLLVTRSEFLGKISDTIGIGAPFELAPLTTQAALEAVRGPLAGTGRNFAKGAAERLVSDLRTSRVSGADGRESLVATDLIEPTLLQVVCERLWRDLPTSVATITVSDVRTYADVDRVLADHYGQTIASVADECDMSANRLRSWLLRTFVSDIGARKTAYESGPQTAGMPSAILRALTDRHILTAGERDGARWYALLSDRLLEPLRRAVDERVAPLGPAGYLRTAKRALAAGEMELAKRKAFEARDAAAESDVSLRAAAESLLGNLMYEHEEPAEAELHYLAAASFFEATRDTKAVASSLAAAGQMLAAQGRFSEAVRQLRAAVNRMPNDPMMQTQLALALWKLGEGQAAVAILTAVLATDSANKEARRVRGEILADVGDANGAMQDLDLAAREADPAAHAAYGLALAELGHKKQAEQEIDDVLDKNGWNGPALLYAARAFSLNGDQIRARDLAKRAVIATDPELSPPHRVLARQLAARQNGRPD